MIASFADSKTEKLFNGIRVRAFEAFLDRGRMKLELINQARTLRDLAAIPGNKLEALGGNRKGQHSIRINDQYRICFEWKEDNNVYNVEITDYH